MNKIDLFISSESETMNGLTESDSDEFRIIRNEIEKKIQSELLDKNDYGDALTLEGSDYTGGIGIIMTLYSKKFLNDIVLQTGSELKERVIYKAKVRDSDVRLRIDYEKYLISNKDEREKLVLKNIVDSIEALDKKIKKHKDVTFYGEKLIEDICRLFKFNPDKNI